MSANTSNRLAGISGTLWIILVLVGFGAIAGFSPSITDSKADVVEYFADIDASRVYVGEYLEILGFLLFAVFAARLLSILREAEGGTGRLSRLALGGAVLIVALTLAGVAPLMAGTYRAEHGGLGEDSLVALNDLRVALYWMSLFVAPLFLLPVGLLIARTAVFPRWLGWAAIALGAVLLLGLLVPTSGIGDIASMLMGFWVFVVSVLFVVRSGRYAPTRRPDLA